ncbi:MAG: TetR/AcrR family transcriptional regulator [Actinomycetota bacterium]
MRLPADQRREQLLDVATEVFARHGFHAASMDEIAESAGVTKPVLYQHFPSKRALYIELLTQTGEQLLRALREVTHSASTGRERVESGFRAYFGFVADSRAGFRLLFSSSIRTDPEFVGIVDRVVRAAADVIATLIEIPVSEEHRHVLANALVGMAEAIGHDATDVGSPRPDGTRADPEQLASWLAEFAWFGLRGVRAETPSQLP